MGFAAALAFVNGSAGETILPAWARLVVGALNAGLVVLVAGSQPRESPPGNRKLPKWDRDSLGGPGAVGGLVLCAFALGPLGSSGCLTDGATRLEVLSVLAGLMVWLAVLAWRKNR
jgi:hypothetical protein